MARASLKKLSRIKLTYQELATVFDDLKRGNDREAAIIGGTVVESVLEDLVRSRMIAGLDAEINGRLFTGTGPLASFAMKLELGYALGLVGNKDRQNLDCIKDIRNAFAHAPISLRFQADSIADACKSLTGSATKTLRPKLGPKARYLAVAAELCFRLLGDSLEAARPIAPTP